MFLMSSDQRVGDRQRDIPSILPCLLYLYNTKNSVCCLLKLSYGVPFHSEKFTKAVFDI